MKTSSLIFILLWIFSIPLIAQTPQWARTTINQSTQTHDANQIKVDIDGSIYVAGNFPYQLKFSDSNMVLNGLGGNNTYLYKRSATGELLWAKDIGGFFQNNLFNMNIDHAGNVYLIGEFRNNLAVGSGGNSISLTSNGYSDAYIVKYSGEGNLLGAYSVGGTSRDKFTAITFDSQNNIILAGDFKGEVDFNLGQNSHIENCTGITLVKYTDTFEFISAYKLNSTYGHVTNIEVNAENALIFGGRFRESITIDSGEGLTGGPQFTNFGFVMKVSDTFAFEWIVGVTGTASQYLRDMQLNQSGDIYVAGDMSETANFLSHDQTEIHKNSSGSNDIFFAKISPIGNFEWVHAMGGPGKDYAFAIDLDTSGNIFLAGSFSQTMDFDPGSGTAEFTSEGSSSSYVSIYTPNGAYANTFTYDNPFISDPGYQGGNAASGIALNSYNDIYLTGWFKTAINFDPTQPGFEFTTMKQDCYLLKVGSVIVGLPEQRATYPISIYPNPARDVVHIEALNIQNLEIYTIHGKLIYSKLAKTLGDKQTIGISHLPAGTYILSLTANDGFVRSEKFMVVR